MTVVTDEGRELERRVLSCMMFSREGALEALEVVSPSDFWNPKHEAIAEVIAEAVANNAPTDPLALSAAISARSGVTPSELYEIASDGRTAASAGFYAEALLQHAIRRRLQHAAAGINQLATEGDLPAAEIVEKAREMIDSTSSTVRVQTHTIGETLPGLWASLREPPQFVSTPWADLNRLIGGLRPGALTIVGARPGVGKTVIGLQLAKQLATVGACGFVSLEMTTQDLQKRLVAQTARVPLSLLVNNKLSENNWQAVKMVEAEMKSWQLFVAEGVETITQVRSFIRSLHRRGNLKGVVIDYLQLMTSGKQVESRQQEVSSFSRQLKLLALELNIPIVALSQLNRAVESRKDLRPQLSDLRESGSIEQDADVVILLHRDEQKRASEMDLIVAKNRSGMKGEVTLIWEGGLSRALTKGWTPSALIDEEEARFA